MIDKSKPYVSVTVDDGTFNIEAHNFKGRGCLKAVTDIQKDLGGEVVRSQDKPEINLPAPVVKQTLKH